MYIGCDPSASDEEVIVACYTKSLIPRWSINPPIYLERLAEERKSRFLFFILSICQHLNDKHVAILAKKESVMFASPVPESENVESSQPEEAASSAAGTERDEYGEPYGTPEESPEVNSSEMKSPPSSEAEFTSSSDDMEVDSDFEEEVGGIFFDKTSWRCEDCCSEIIDGKCPNGHDLRRCMACDWHLVDGTCPKCCKNCEGCGMGLVEGACLGCETDEEDLIAADNADGIWRCVYCQWEVEADNETDGNCHCLNSQGEARYLDLSECFDYEPADSDSSHAESCSDDGDEPDSDDEAFIDDETVAIEGLFDPAAEIVSFARIIPAKHHTSPFTRVNDDAKAVLEAEDKENVEPNASSDVEIVEDPNVERSNVIDIESMTM